jgi:hypothetical protein
MLRRLYERGSRWSGSTTLTAVNSPPPPGVFRIRDVMIRIRGSVLLDYGSGSSSFPQWLSRCQQKLSFIFNNFFLINFLPYIYTSLQRYGNKLLRSHKTESFKVFLNFSVLLIEGCESGHIITDPGGPKT